MLIDKLNHGIDELKLTIPQAAQQRMLDYLELILKWNKVDNLTAITKPAEMVTKHLLDSLAILPYISGKSVLDVGSGAGLPGIPLALSLPELHFDLIDSQAKRTRFLQQVMIELEIKNISVIHSRVEEHHPKQKYNTIISRAFAHLEALTELTTPLLAEAGKLIVMQGAKVEKYSGNDLVISEVDTIHLPDCDDQRHITILMKG